MRTYEIIKKAYKGQVCRVGHFFVINLWS